MEPAGSDASDIHNNNNNNNNNNLHNHINSNGASLSRLISNATVGSHPRKGSVVDSTPPTSNGMQSPQLPQGGLNQQQPHHISRQPSSQIPKKLVATANNSPAPKQQQQQQPTAAAGGGGGSKKYDNNNTSDKDSLLEQIGDSTKAQLSTLFLGRERDGTVTVEQFSEMLNEMDNVYDASGWKYSTQRMDTIIQELSKAGHPLSLEQCLLKTAQYIAMMAAEDRASRKNATKAIRQEVHYVGLLQLMWQGIRCRRVTAHHVYLWKGVDLTVPASTSMVIHLLLMTIIVSACLVGILLMRGSQEIDDQAKRHAVEIHTMSEGVVRIWGAKRAEQIGTIMETTAATLTHMFEDRIVVTYQGASLGFLAVAQDYFSQLKRSQELYSNNVRERAQRLAASFAVGFNVAPTLTDAMNRLNAAIKGVSMPSGFSVSVYRTRDSTLLYSNSVYPTALQMSCHSKAGTSSLVGGTIGTSLEQGVYGGSMSAAFGVSICVFSNTTLDAVSLFKFFAPYANLMANKVVASGYFAEFGYVSSRVGSNASTPVRFASGTFQPNMGLALYTALTNDKKTFAGQLYEQLTGDGMAVGYVCDTVIDYWACVSTSRYHLSYQGGFARRATTFPTNAGKMTLFVGYITPQGDYVMSNDGLNSLASLSITNRTQLLSSLMGTKERSPRTYTFLAQLKAQNSGFVTSQSVSGPSAYVGYAKGSIQPFFTTSETPVDLVLAPIRNELKNLFSELRGTLSTRGAEVNIFSRSLSINGQETLNDGECNFSDGCTDDAWYNDAVKESFRTSSTNLKVVLASDETARRRTALTATYNYEFDLVLVTDVRISWLDDWFRGHTIAVAVALGVCLPFLVTFLVSLVTTAVLKFIEKEYHKFRETTLAERAQFHELVKDVLPDYIQQRVILGEMLIAEQHPLLTFFFGDIEGWTDISMKLSPDERVRYLAYTFWVIDTTAEHYGIHKIKTIGDCYFAVSGLEDQNRSSGEEPQDPRQHQLFRMSAFGCVLLMLLKKSHALHYPERTEAFRKLMGQRDLGLIELPKMKLGIHSGPAIAGVVDVGRAPHFDCFGPSVNLTSRMETTAPVGRIQLSQSTMEILDRLSRSVGPNTFTFGAPRKTLVKGYGTVTTFVIMSTTLRIPDAVLTSLKAKRAVKRFRFDQGNDTGEGDVTGSSHVSVARPDTHSSVASSITSLANQ